MNSKTTIQHVLAAAESYSEDLSTGLADGTYEDGADELPLLGAAIEEMRHDIISLSLIEATMAKIALIACRDANAEAVVLDRLIDRLQEAISGTTREKCSSCGDRACTGGCG